jgi:hypothetical protein
MYINQGQPIELVPTDPWDLVTVTGSGPFCGVVVQADSSDYETIIVRLAEPLHYKGNEARFIVASTRHVGKKFDRTGDQTAFCNMASLTEKEALAGIFRPDPSAASRLELIGDISWR